MPTDSLNETKKSLEFALKGMNTIEGWRIALADFEKYCDVCPEVTDELKMRAREPIATALWHFSPMLAVDEFIAAVPKISDGDLLFLMLVTVTQHAPTALSAMHYLMWLRAELQNELIDFRKSGIFSKEKLDRVDPNKKPTYKPMLLALAMCAKQELTQSAA